MGYDEHVGLGAGAEPQHCRGEYAYTRDLLRLDSRRASTTLAEIPMELQRVQTPLRVREWERSLVAHPDKEFCNYLVRGITEGFRVGFRYSSCSCTRAKSNMQSAVSNPKVVEEYLAKEVEKGRVVGPLELDTLPGVHVSRFGVIPKSHRPGEWRLIVDLSHPEGASVNDGIEPELCSLSYTSVDEAVRRIRARGRGTLMAKLDVESAYRMVPVHPTDRPLLGMVWKGRLYIDSALPFGLRSAPKIFNSLADAIQWILEQQGVEVIHYLDDFLIFGDPESQECKLALETVKALCARLGVPIALHKTEGPTCRLTFLGIELDSESCTLRLPVEKLQRLQREIAQWMGKSSCTKRELLSLIGQLQHACCVVRPGRTFLRRMISLAKMAKQLHHHIRLNRGFKSDLQWWSCFLPNWNGVSMMARAPRRYDATVTSDASGGWGCGAFSSTGYWFQLQWPGSWEKLHITIKELLPVVVGIAMWGSKWQGKTVRCRCDNAAVVAILNSGSSKDDRAMHLLRSLFFFLAIYDVSVFAEHIAGVENRAADALSRGNHQLFRSQVPAAKQEPSQVPEELRQALVLSQPDWTSHSWTRLLTNFLGRALQNRPSARTAAAKTVS